MELSLLGIYILEKDNNNDVIWTWIYPKLSNDERNILQQRCNFQNEGNYLFLKLKSLWYYILIQGCNDSLKTIKQFAVIFKSNQFNPSKFHKILEILNMKYVESCNPIEIQKLYWAIYTGNRTNFNNNGLNPIKKFERTDQTGIIKDLIQIFQLETILIFNAILLKRRVLFYHQDLQTLLKYVEAASSLVHRRDRNLYLYPWVEDNPEELLEFKSKNWYAVGTVQKSLLLKTDLFDLIVNIPNTEIQITPNAKESFTMTKTHKEIALLMVQLAQDTNVSDYDIESALTEKIDDIITQLKSLATIDNGTEKFITLELLRSQKFNANTETFLFNLALSENLMLL